MRQAARYDGFLGLLRLLNTVGLFEGLGILWMLVVRLEPAACQILPLFCL